MRLRASIHDCDSRLNLNVIKTLLKEHKATSMSDVKKNAYNVHTVSHKKFVYVNHLS